MGRSDKKTFAMAALYVAAFFFCMALVREAAVLSFGLPGPSPARLLAFAPIAVLLLLGLGWASSSRSLPWQTLLQGLAVGLLAAALPVLDGGFFGYWTVFPLALGIKAAAVVLLGLLAACLLRYLQRRMLPGQDA